MAHHYDGPEPRRTSHPGSKQAILEKEREIERLQKEKESIIEADKITNEKAWQLSQDIQELKEQIAWQEKELIKKTLELNKLCTHERTREEHDYSPGSYLNKEEYITKIYCDICGEMIDKKVKYGGFG